MITQRTIQKTLVLLRKEGWTRTLHRVSLKAINTLFLCKILRGMTFSQVEPAFLKCPDGYSSMFLSPVLIRGFAKNPDYQMSASFVEEALAKGDECYAICHGETLAAYGWYSVNPTRIDPPDLVVHFRKEYVYMYKGFTLARYRGQRLHAIGTSLALRCYRARGFSGLLSYVESNNFDSLKSCTRMGYTSFGTAYVGKIFGRYFQGRSHGCKQVGFGVARAPSAAVALPPDVRPASQTAPMA